MNTRHFAAAVVLTLAVPLCLAAVPWFSRSTPSEVDLLMLNWLYMAAPQLLVAALGWLSEKFRAFATPLLVILTLLLLGFQAWIWLWVPAREGAMAWLFYWPIASISVLLGLGAQFALRKRFTSVP